VWAGLAGDVGHRAAPGVSGSRAEGAGAFEPGDLETACAGSDYDEFRSSSDESGSHATRRWREVDSNYRFRMRSSSNRGRGFWGDRSVAGIERSRLQLAGQA
jgi:hypothetical protein